MATRTEKRACYRLNLEELPHLEARLKFPNDHFQTTRIKDLSASGFSCLLPDYISIRKTDLIYTAFILPFKEPEPIQAKAYLIAMTSRGDHSHRILRFRFSSYLNNCKQDVLHRFIVRKKLELMRKAGN